MRLGPGSPPGSKEAFRKQLREQFRSGTASLDEALATAMMSLVPLLRQTLERLSNPGPSVIPTGRGSLQAQAVSRISGVSGREDG